MQRAIFPYDVEEQLIGEFFDHATTGFFVDVGANDPKEGSQTFHLEHLGWSGILVEPQPELAERLRQERRARVFQVACSSPENAGRTLTLNLAGAHSSLDPNFYIAGMQKQGAVQVEARTLDDILIEVGAPSPIDFVSIDVEAHEVEVLAGFDLQRWRPRLILIEDLAFNLRAHNALRSCGYRWVRRTGLNGWYVPETSDMRAGPLGQWQFFRKHYLGLPFRHVRDAKRRLRDRILQKIK